MKEDILSLKNIYQILFVNDYPVYSTGIIAKNKHVGLTLTKFWQNIILKNFKSRKYGRIIWRTEGGRNRYISEICNRSERLTVYSDYAQELYMEANPKVIQGQIEQFVEFLTERDFNYTVFMQKMDAYIELLTMKDKAFSHEAHMFFADAMEYGKKIEKHGKHGQAFLGGWFLCFLTLHALSGNGEGEETLRKFRNKETFSLVYLYERFLEENKFETADLVLWTTDDSEICKEPLDHTHFFGREEELFELDEMLSRKGKFLISGIGGIGKTELMRQFIRRCKGEKDLDYICVIQYKGNMRDSLLNLFPKVVGADADERLQEALAILKEYEGQNGLIAVDNVTNDMQTDAEIGLLLQLSAPVFMTSRFSEMPGFETYQVKNIEKKAGSLIFRDNYGKILNLEEKQELERILDTPMWCHSLTLRLLGRVAKINDLALTDFFAKVRRKEAISQESDTSNQLKPIYQQIYSTTGLGMYESFLQIFALMPYGSYRTDIIQKYLGGLFESNQAVKKCLQETCQAGLLEYRDGGYSMHPFVAECILPEQLAVEVILPYLDMLIEELHIYFEDYLVNGVEHCFYEVDDIILPVTLKNMIRMVPDMVMHTTGILEEEYFKLVLLALSMEYVAVGRVGKNVDEIVALYQRIEKCSKKTEICLAIIMLEYGYDKKDDLEKGFRSVEHLRDVSPLLKDILLTEIMDRMFLLGEYELTGEIALYNWEIGGGSNARMSAASLLAILENQKGNIAEMERWLRAGIAVGEESRENTRNEMCQLQVNLFGILMSRREFQEAEQIVKEFRKRADAEDAGINLKWIYLYCMGMLKSHREDANHGIAELSAAVEMADKYMIDRQSGNYLNSLVELAMACQKAHIWEKSEDYYNKALQECEKMMGQEFGKARILNNAGVMYLNWGKYDKALEFFEESYKIGKLMGGLFVGEATNNMSKVYRKLGNRKKELHYLKEALPILEGFYGKDHPKVIEAHSRVEQE